MAPLTNNAIASATLALVAAQAAPVFQGTAPKNGNIDIDIAGTYSSVFPAAVVAGDVANMVLSTVNMDALKHNNKGDERSGKGKEDIVERFLAKAEASTTEGNGVVMARAHEAASSVTFENTVGKDGKPSLKLKRNDIADDCFLFPH